MSGGEVAVVLLRESRALSCCNTSQARLQSSIRALAHFPTAPVPETHDASSAICCMRVSRKVASRAPKASSVGIRSSSAFGTEGNVAFDKRSSPNSASSSASASSTEVRVSILSMREKTVVFGDRSADSAEVESMSKRDVCVHGRSRMVVTAESVEKVWFMVSFRECVCSTLNVQLYARWVHHDDDNMLGKYCTVLSCVHGSSNDSFFRTKGSHVGLQWLHDVCFTT